MDKVYEIAIVGAGVSGVTVALRSAEMGISTLLIEKNNSVVNGPPFCHLHAGGNLYPDISDEQCLKLLHQSIDMAKLYPESIDQRPTFVSIPKTEKYKTRDLVDRLDKLVSEYEDLIAKDVSNKVLGEPREYYKLYQKEDLDRLKKSKSIQNPTTQDDWMVEVAKTVNYDELKFPVILVSEFGWNLFRLAAQAHLAIKKLEHCDLKLGTKVLEVQDFTQSKENFNWKITTNQGVYYAKYLLNAAGFKTGEIDNELNLEENRMVEFKAAYVSHWDGVEGRLPEMIFHGERGTPHGMAQLTPYHNHFYQIHGMTEDITLFQGGLVKSKGENAQPHLDDSFDSKIEKGWSTKEVNDRTQRAIAFVAHFVPSFDTAKVAGPPLYGAQQIPGEDASLRVAEVSFPKKFYARSEIVKASSALDVADQVIADLKKLQVINPTLDSQRSFDILNSILASDINALAPQIAENRGYPSDMGLLYRNSIKDK